MHGVVENEVCLQVGHITRVHNNSEGDSNWLTSKLNSDNETTIIAHCDIYASLALVHSVITMHRVQGFLFPS